MKSIELESYILDTLMPDLVGHDRTPGAFLVYLSLSRRAREEETETVQVSLRAVAESTGLSKRAVQDGIAHLMKRGLLSVSRKGITAVAKFTPLLPWSQGP